MTLRENAIEMIKESVTEAATKQHERNYEKLHVWRDGTVSWSTFTSQSDDKIDAQAEHFAAVPSVICAGTGSYACECDYCNEVYNADTEQLAKEEGREYDRSTKWDTFAEAIRECVNDSDLSDLENAMVADVNEIPLGYFDDEKGAA